MHKESVVLVHGLWFNGLDMSLLRLRLNRAGYNARQFSYPSVRSSPLMNAMALNAFMRRLNSDTVHLVGHSLGGLIVLRMLEHAATLPVGRVVLTGTPVAESFAARRLARLPGGRAALGRSLPEWLESARPALYGRFEIGVVAGSLPLGLGRLVAPDLPGPSDGVVSVAETRLPGMRDHIVLNVSHSGMLLSRAVAHQVCAFLREGAFAHQG